MNKKIKYFSVNYDEDEIKELKEAFYINGCDIFYMLYDNSPCLYINGKILEEKYKFLLDNEIKWTNVRLSSLKKNLINENDSKAF